MTVDLNAKLASINLQLSESATQELLAHSNYCSSYEFVQEILIILSSTIVTGLPTQNIQTLDLRLKVLSDTAIASLLEYFAGVQKTIQKLLYFRDKLTSDDFELEFQETVSCFLNDFHAKLLSMQIRMRSEPNERYSPIWLQGEVKRAMDALKYCEYCIDIGILNGITNIVKKDHAWIFLYLKVHKLVFSKMDLMLQNCTETTIQTCNECILLLEPALSENLKKLVAIAQGTCLLGLRTDLEYSLFDKFVEILCSKYPQIHDIYLEKDTSNVSDFRFDTWLLNQLEYQYIKVCRSNLYLENFNPVKPAIVLMADCAESLLQPIVSNSYKMMHIVLYEEIKIGDYIKTLFGFYLFLDSIAPTRFYQLVDTLLGNSLPDLIHEIHEQVQFQCSDGDLGILENCEFELKSATKDSLDIYDILIIDFKLPSKAKLIISNKLESRLGDISRFLAKLQRCFRNLSNLRSPTILPLHNIITVYANHLILNIIRPCWTEFETIMPISDPLKLQAELESIVTTIEKATFSQVKTINQNGGIRVALDKLIKDCKCGVVDGELLEFLKDAMEANGIQFY